MDNYNYPEGSDTPDAPWNQCEQEEMEVEASVSMCLSKSVNLMVNDYVATKWVDCETDEDGHAYRIGGIDYDYSDCNGKAAYEENHYSIMSLLKLLREYIDKDIKSLTEELCKEGITDIDKRKIKSKISRLESIKDDASDWDEDEFTVTIDE